MRKLLAWFLNSQKRRARRRLARTGLTADQLAAETVVTGKAWDDFCDTLKAAGGSVVGFGNPDDPLSRAEGFRYLSRLIRAALDNFIESGDPDQPALRRLVDGTVKLGADNPDFIYRNAVLDGRHEYVLSGRLGTTFIIMSTQDGDYTDQRDTQMAFSGQLTTDELEIGPDGEVEIVLANERPAGAANWLPTSPNTKMLMLRELLRDRDRDVPSKLTIRRREPVAPVPFGPARLSDGLAQAGQFVAGASLMFTRWANGMKSHTNTLPRFDQAKSDAAGGDPQMAYFHSYWAVPLGKALIIETPVPECTTWNCVLQNHWMESLDYRVEQIHVNKHSASYRPDGSVRIVVAHEDPGVPNWLRTQGHEFGTIAFRWNRAASHPEPQARLIDVAELEALRAEEAAAPSTGLAYEPAPTQGKNPGKNQGRQAA